MEKEEQILEEIRITNLIFEEIRKINWTIDKIENKLDDIIITMDEINEKLDIIENDLEVIQETTEFPCTAAEETIKRMWLIQPKLFIIE